MRNGNVKFKVAAFGSLFKVFEKFQIATFRFKFSKVRSPQLGRKIYCPSFETPNFIRRA